MSTPMWPSSWNARMRWSGMPLPSVTCGAVTSIPSLTRSGRPSASLRSSSPCGSTSTACRVRSTEVTALARDRLEVLDLRRLDVVRRIETENLPEERQEDLLRAPDRVGAAEAVALALEGDVCIRDAVALECFRDRFGLRRRHDAVVEALEQQERLGDLVRVRDRRALAIELGLLRPLPDEELVVARLELVRVLVERHEIGDAELRDAGGEDVADRHCHQCRVPARAAAGDDDAIGVREPALDQVTRGGLGVVDVDLAPAPAETFAELTAVAGAPAVVDVADREAAARNELDLEVEHRQRVGRRAAVHQDDKRRQLAFGRFEVGIRRRVVEGVCLAVLRGDGDRLRLRDVSVVELVLHRTTQDLASAA